jgi:hypothetical protein
MDNNNWVKNMLHFAAGFNKILMSIERKRNFETLRLRSA